jgi:hypothetical protein
LKFNRSLIRQLDFQSLHGVTLPYPANAFNNAH